MTLFSDVKRKRLLELLSEEKELFEKMRKITDEQTELLSRDDIEAFDKSLDKSQKLIVKINGLHQESDILMQSYVSFASENKRGAVAEIDGLYAQIKDILADIAEKNRENTVIAKEKNEQYTSSINKLSMGRKSLGLYAQGAIYGAEYFDKKT